MGSSSSNFCHSGFFSNQNVEKLCVVLPSEAVQRTCSRPTMFSGSHRFLRVEEQLEQDEKAIRYHSLQVDEVTDAAVHVFYHAACTVGALQHGL